MTLMTHRNYANRERGQVLFGTVLLFLFISSIIVFGISRSVFHQLKTAIDFSDSREGYFLSEALAEDTVYRIMHAYPVGFSATLSLNGQTASALIIDGPGTKEIISTADWDDLVRKTRMRMTFGSGGSFFYGVQVGQGGLDMYNTSEVIGNIHSSGPVTGNNSTQSNYNYIRGDVLSSGTGGIISKIHATSSAYAHTIQNSVIDKDAYFQVLTGTTVGGNQYPGSPDQATTSLPLDESLIDDWEADAVAGGSVTCTNGEYLIDADTTFGPKKVPCDLRIESNPTITINGAIWVTGNIHVVNQPVVRVSPAYTDVTIPIIADNPSNRLTSSSILLDNNTFFQGSGNNSYLLLVSRNESASQGGAVDAITLANSVSGELLLYAPQGNVTMNNSVDLREVTAYKLTLRNSAKVIYKSGLADVHFTSGPSGGYEILDWREIE